MSQPGPQACGNPSCSTQSPTLQQCGRCRKAAYCSQTCQAAAWPSHKARCRRPNYIIRFELDPDEVSDPPVSRTLSCPADATFHQLHAALQAAFGWASTHSFDFAVPNPDYEPPGDIRDFMAQQMMLHSGGGRDNPARPQEYLFRVVDPASGTDFNPFSGGGIDRVHEGRRSHPHTPEKKADRYKLWQLLDNAEYKDHPIIYTYDFGDNWEHHLTVTGRADASDADPATAAGLFACLDGTGHPVAEDVGGTRGWEDLKEAYRAARPTEDQRERREWFEVQASNADPRGLAGGRASEWDRDGVERKLRANAGMTVY
ncbi:MM3350-like domain-containing protein [Xylariaceae sp. FL0804]|nr:MM3350-like domain-containing protein [Xylariaceae sp. FL0804]